jgi:hypothetical protein
VWDAEKLIKKTMNTIQGGKACINIDGERSQYSNTYQSLRQGDLISPVMFNVVAEVLATLMKKAASQGKVKGVLTHILPHEITHIQYIDDIILMMAGGDQSITNMEFMLYYIFRTHELDKYRIANMLNCKLGEIPMKYLGIPLNDTKLCMCAFSYITEKVAKCIPPWKGKNMSSRTERFSLIVAWLACQPTQWAFICYLLIPTEEWTPLDPDSFGEG